MDLNLVPDPDCHSCAREPLCKLPSIFGVKTVQMRGACIVECTNGQRDARYRHTNYDVFCVMDFPGQEEDAAGLPLTGESLDLVEEFCMRAGFDLEKVYITNMVKCKPPGRKPAAAEIKACRTHIEYELNLIKPKVIILLGAMNLKLFNLHGLGGLKSIHGQLYTKALPKCPGSPEYKIVPSFHPNYFKTGRVDVDKLKASAVRDFKFAKAVLDFDPNVDSKIEIKAHATTDYVVCDTVEKVANFAEELNQTKVFAFDTESTSLGFMKSPMLCFSFSKGLRQNAIVPFLSHSEDLNSITWKGVGYDVYSTEIFSAEDRRKVCEILKQPFENPEIGKAAHNIKYDLNVLRYWTDIQIKGFLFDTQIMHHLLNEQRPHDLETLADIEFSVGDYSADKRAITGTGKELTHTYDYVPDHILWPYAAMDAECCWRLLNLYYNELLIRPNLWKLYQEESAPAIRSFARAEWRGNKLNPNVIEPLLEEYQARQRKLLVEMRKDTYPDFNPQSHDQVRKAFLEMGLGARIENKKKASGYSADKEALGEMRYEVPLADNILNYRTNGKIISTYLENARKDIDLDGRIRCSFNLTGTDSGRISCKFLHQIPRIDSKRVEQKLPVLRDMFICEDGKSYVYADYSQLELYIVALLADDQTMLRMFANGEDIHMATSEAILGYLTGVERVDAYNRQECGKRVNFGVVYGSEGFQLLKTCQWMDAEGKTHPLTREMLDEGMKRFKKLYPNLANYLETLPDELRMRNGTLTTVFGRERRFGRRLNESSEALRKRAEREAVNCSVQSPAGALAIRTINVIDAYLQEWIEQGTLQEDDVVLLNSVHDSVAYEVSDHLVDWFVPLLQGTAQRPIAELKNYEFKIKVGVGKSWTEAELNAG